MKPRTVRAGLAAVLVAVVVAVAGCGSTGNSPAPVRASSTALPDDPGVSPGTPKHTYSAVPIEAAEKFAVEFIKLYGAFTPAAPSPGRTWLESWRSRALPNVVDRAEAEFDQTWGWTWDLQVQAQDVLPAGPAQIDAAFGTVTVRIPARRYVIGLLALRPEDGHWQNMRFDVVVGPRTPADPASELSVYRIEMSGA